MLLSFFYDSEKCFVSIIGMKIISRPNLLLVPVRYDTEKCFISIIGMKIFLGQNLLLFFLLWSRKMLYKYDKDEKFSKTKFLACFFLVLLVEKCSISIIGAKIFLGQNMLLVPFCYHSEKFCVSMIWMKIFRGQSLLLVSFLFC